MDLMVYVQTLASRRTSGGPLKAGQVYLRASDSSHRLHSTKPSQSLISKIRNSSSNRINTGTSSLTPPRGSDILPSDLKTDPLSSPLLQYALSSWVLQKGFSEADSVRSRALVEQECELEKLFLKSTIKYVWWRSMYECVFIFDTGNTASLVLSVQTNEIKSIFLERSLASFSNPDRFASVVMTERFLIASHRESLTLQLVEYDLPKPSPMNSNPPSSLDISKTKAIKIMYQPIKPGASLAFNCLQTFLVLWWNSPLLQVV